MNSDETDTVGTDEEGDSWARVVEKTTQVGNKVYWMNCPAHLTNWQPFSITSIQGQEAMLDICAYPVPLAQLQVYFTF